MHMRLEHLRERLLREGVAHRHVRRYVTELADHYEDAFAAEKAKGLSHDAAAAAAWDRIGNTEELAMTALSRPELRSVYARFSPAIFGAGPILAWMVLFPATCAAIVLARPLLVSAVSGPLPPQVIALFQSICFAYARVIPVMIGIGMLVLAHRRAVAMTWPVIGAVLIALGAGTSALFIIPPAAGHPGELEAGNVLVNLFTASDLPPPESWWMAPSFAIVLLNVVLILSPIAYWRRREAMA